MTRLKMSTAFPSYIRSVVFLVAVQSLIFVGAKKPVALFVFGDSIFDAGNNNYIESARHANVWPYGETFFDYPTGRFSDGRTIPDFICGYANLPLLPPYLQQGFSNYTYGVNFASAGAGVLLKTHQGRAIDLKTQVDNFNKVVKQLRQELGSKEEADDFFSSAVYLISVGGNDYFDAFEEIPSLFLSQHSMDRFVGSVINNYTHAIQEIYNKGARKFGFLNLSPMGCIPKLRAERDGCIEELVEVAKLHNKQLSQTLQNLARNRLDGFKYTILDFFTSITQIADNPSKYGFKEANTACCGSGPYRGHFNCGMASEFELCTDPSEYLYFDSVHSTERAYKHLAELFWTGSSNMSLPYSLKQLFDMGRNPHLNSKLFSSLR